jgi:hypothetical protein
MEKLKVNALGFPTLPVSDILTIKNFSNLSNNIYYSIMDLSGKEIITNKIIEFYEDLIKISVKSLKNGIYLVRLFNEQSFVINSFQVSK